MGYAPTTWEKKVGAFNRGGSELEQDLLARQNYGKSIAGRGHGIRDSEHIFNIIGGNKHGDQGVSVLSHVDMFESQMFMQRKESIKNNNNNK